MHPRFTPAPPNRPPAPPPSYDALRKQRAEALRAATHRAQRSFLVVNAIPFVTGIVLSCFTDVPAASVHGHLTLGLVWGVLQCVLFVASAWRYETRSTRSGDPIEESLAR
ncbi:DUF485 domain-containing protein [Streptomyces canus]|uniref:DUF485 domain-containing protein n=1 Tax=Streptomyces canus TaxID=58343 RepID=UPI00371DFBA1